MSVICLAVDGVDRAVLSVQALCIYRRWASICQPANSLVSTSTPQLLALAEVFVACRLGVWSWLVMPVAPLSPLMSSVSHLPRLLQKHDSARQTYRSTRGHCVVSIHDVSADSEGSIIVDQTQKASVPACQMCEPALQDIATGSVCM